jgi:hypothetical protein
VDCLVSRFCDTTNLGVVVLFCIVLDVELFGNDGSVIRLCMDLIDECNGNAPDLYSGGIGFDSQPGNRLLCLRFLWFFSVC